MIKTASALLCLILLAAPSVTAAVGQRSSKTVWRFEVSYWTVPEEVVSGQPVTLLFEARHKDAGRILTVSDTSIWIITPDKDEEAIIPIVEWEFALGKINKTYVFKDSVRYTVRFLGHIWDFEDPGNHGIVILEFIQEVKAKSPTSVIYEGLRSLALISNLIPLLSVAGASLVIAGAVIVLRYGRKARKE